MNIIFILLIILVLIIIYYIFSKTPLEELEEIIPEGVDGNVEKLLTKVQQRWFKKAEDWKVIGTLQQYNIDDKYEAYKAYTEMVKQAEPEDYHEFTELVQRQDIPVADQNLQLALLNSVTKPTKKVKWYKDTQNVHDTKLNKDITKRYNKIKTLNDFNVNEKDIDNLVANNEKANTVWSKIKTSKAFVSSLNDTEKDYTLNIFARSLDPMNKDVKKELQNSFIGALEDSVENKTIVCLKGRVARLSNSLSQIDNACKDNIKTKQVLLNEMLGVASKISEKILNEASPEDIKSYNDMNNPKLDEKMKNEITTELSTIYKEPDNKPIINEVLLAL